MKTQTTKKSQVIGCRVSFQEYDKLGVKCIEEGKKISQVLKQAVREYLTNMSHQIIDGRVVVDLVSGDPEGGIFSLMSAYHEFLSEVLSCAKENHLKEIESIFEKWKIDMGNQIDNFPRIWIKRPE